MRALVRLATVGCVAAAAAAVAGAATAAPSPAPALIDRAVESGTLDFSTGQLYKAYAMFAWERLPAAYQSPTKFDGTLPLLQLRQNLDGVSGLAKLELAALVGTGPSDPGTSTCELSPLPSTSTLATKNFYFEYNAAEVNEGPDGMTIDYFAQSLETVWSTEIDGFRWAAPPKSVTNPAPLGKYLVKVQQLSPVLYGYVSNFGTGAGTVGNNPNTAWNDQDAQASCMGLNSDYNSFPGTPERALDATTAHEFNHSIQFGYGAIADDDGYENEPDSVFVEGGATWMEDEVFDYANDNYNYLWPNFPESMGYHGEDEAPLIGESSPYPYFITWRGLTERYGTAKPGAGENVMQDFWEITSRNEASNLDAMNRALQKRGTTLASAYHAYAIAVKFNARCGKGYPYPYCFEEGPAYVSGDGVQEGAGPTEPHASVVVGDVYVGRLQDNYALNWIALPAQAASYRLILDNPAAAGAFRVTVACDTGSKLLLTHLGEVGGGKSAATTVRRANECAEIAAVVSNVTQTSANPETRSERPYVLSLS